MVYSSCRACTPPPPLPPLPHCRSVMIHTHSDILTDWISSHTNTLAFYWLRTPNCVCVDGERAGNMSSTYHAVFPVRKRPRFDQSQGQYSRGSVLPVHLLNSPIKGELTVCSRRSRIYLSCSNWLIVAVRRWDWVVHHVPTEGCRRGWSCSRASRIAPHKVERARGF